MATPLDARRVGRIQTHGTWRIRSSHKSNRRKSSRHDSLWDACALHEQHEADAVEHKSSAVSGSETLPRSRPAAGGLLRDQGGAGSRGSDGGSDDEAGALHPTPLMAAAASPGPDEVSSACVFLCGRDIVCDDARCKAGGWTGAWSKGPAPAPMSSIRWTRQRSCTWGVLLRLARGSVLFL